MKILNLNSFTRGWLVGNFENSIFNKDYEIGIKKLNTDYYEKSHCHRLSDEITIVLNGSILVNNKKYIDGDIIIQEKGEYADCKVLEDCFLVVYRPDGSFPEDKYYL